jgi:predicted site-specific integrase-resolvase
VRTNLLELQVQSVIASVYFHKGDLRVYIELSGNWLEAEFLFSSSSNMQSKVFILCPQLHHVIFKNKVLYKQYEI